LRGILGLATNQEIRPAPLFSTVLRHGTFVLGPIFLLDVELQMIKRMIRPICVSYYQVRGRTDEVIDSDP